MKNFQHFVSRTLLVLVLLLNANVVIYAQCLPDKVNFAAEQQLDVLKPPYIIDEGAIARNEQLFKDHVHCPGNSQCTPQLLAIKSSDVVSFLYKDAYDFLTSPVSPCKDNKCITGVWIIMAMDRQTIQYYFQAAVFKTTQTFANGEVLLGATTFVGKVYDYTSGQFKEVIPADLANHTSSYYNEVLIKHFRNRGKHERGKFLNSDGSLDNTWRGDARRVFYSFQEILGFYSSLNPTEDRNHNFYCHNIYINNSAGLFSHDPKFPWNSWRVKHNTFITVDSDSKINDRVNGLSASTNGTDLAHVCPSSCQSVSYPSAAQAETLSNKRQ